VNIPDSLLNRLPPPLVIHARMGQLYRELALLRRLMRLSQAARDERERRAATPPTLPWEGANHD
jgi:hypothetical protein